MRSVFLCLPALAAGLAACGEPAPTWHADVAPILKAHCADCHSDGGIAPFDLSTYDGAAAVAALAAASAEARTMPPWGASPGDVGLKFDLSLTDAQIETLRAWADAGAPEGDPDDAAAVVPLDLGGLPEHDLELVMPEPYATSAAPGQDEYRCFVFEWPAEETVFVTGYEMLPSNVAIAHHAVAYHIPASFAELAREFDGWDEGPGYDCYGTASHTDFEQDLVAGRVFNQRFIGAWAPGMLGTELVDGTVGVEIKPGSVNVLQLHYSNGGGLEAPTDQTKLRFRTATEVAAQGYYMPWMNFQWPVNPPAMTIPAGAEDVVHQHRAEATTSANATLLGASTEVVQDGVWLHTVFAHMHVLGAGMTYTLHRQDGTSVRLLNLDRYDFDWQREYHFEEPIAVLPGDELEVACTFHNTAAWRTARGATPPEPLDVTWGERSADEMCVAHSLMTAYDGPSSEGPAPAAAR